VRCRHLDQPGWKDSDTEGAGACAAHKTSLSIDVIETFKHEPWAQVPARVWIWPWQASPQRAWGDAALAMSGWLAEQGVHARDARVVVPVGAVLPLARRAWAQACPGWMPAIDTIAGWAQQAAWQGAGVADLTASASADAEAEADWPPLTLHPIADRMHLRAAWARQGWASAWQRRDPKGFDHGLGKVVDMAHAVARRLQAVAPGERAARVDAALAEVAQRASTLAGQPAPGARESVLQQWAVSWAGHAASLGLAGDALFDQMPAAVVTVVAGEAVAPGTEAHWALSLLAHWQAKGVPVLRLHAQPEAAGTGAAWSLAGSPALTPCADAEDEAQQACALVLQTVAAQRLRGELAEPVALLALDRSVVRRMRALLEGAGVRLADETGWRLSTTRAAAALTRLLRAARADASTEDWLDWLKSGWLPERVSVGQPEQERELDLAMAMAQLETHCRRHQVLQAWPLTQAQKLPPAAEALVQWVSASLAILRERWQARGGRLADWLLATEATLKGCGSWEVLMADAAGMAAWQALLGEGPSPAEGDTEGAVAAGPSAQAWSGLAQKTRLDGHRFVRWIGDVMEATTFRPASPPQADVVITTLARAVLRPFAALVMPGAHLGQLGALDPVDPWLNGGLAQALNLSTPTARRAMQWEAWCLLMHQANMVCLVRQGQGSEPLSPSPWLAQWAEQTGVALSQAGDPRPLTEVPTRPCGQPAPAVPLARVPAQLTATAYETLRDCPYRYFAMNVLGLRAQDELEEGVDHADHGTWLHEVLRSFHERRAAWPAALSRGEALALWMQCAHDVAEAQGLNSDAARPYFAPYLADAPRLGAAYLEWLDPHESEGWQVHWMEQRVEATLSVETGAALGLHGQIDRMDTGAEGARHLLLDYKTGNLAKLKSRVKTPDEDTQLAFYAVLAQDHPQAMTAVAGVGTPEDGEVSAAYLHLHRDEVTLVPHADVADTADRLAQAMAVDWQRLRAGQGMPALGEGAACAHCDHAGLCRKAHWPLLPIEMKKEGKP